MKKERHFDQGSNGMSNSFWMTFWLLANTKTESKNQNKSSKIFHVYKFRYSSMYILQISVISSRIYVKKSYYWNHKMLKVSFYMSS